MDFLHDDDTLVAVDKPPGLLVHRTHLAPDRDVLLQRVRNAVRQHVFAVHRLDRQTSGVVLFAKSAEAASTMQVALQESVKQYVGLTRGIMPDSGVMDRALSHPETRRPQSARTDFTRLGVVAERNSLVRFTLHTGRHHQIRRHLAHAGHHLIGDVKYGKGKTNRFFRETYGLPRMALHAESITLVHPRTQQTLTVRAVLAPDLVAFFERLPGYDAAMIRQ